MVREATYGSGLNELDKLVDNLREAPASPQKQKAVTFSEPQRGGLAGHVVTAGLVVILGVLIPLVGWRPSACENTCAFAKDGICDDGADGSSSSKCGLGLDCIDCGAREVLPVPQWGVILACLLITALVVSGVSTVARIFKSWILSPRDPLDSWLRVPLTDSLVSTPMLIKATNSCQVREKSLKILQYILRGSSYCGAFSKATSKHLKSLSKQVSIARRCFKFLRWVKHFEDLAEAKEQKSPMMRFLLYVRIAANFGADWAEDVCSLERVGVLPAGTLSVEFMLFAEYCQLLLALTEIFVTTVKVHKEDEVCQLAVGTGVSGDKLVKQQRKLALVRLELVKFVSDVGKAIYDCELGFAHEGIFIGCSLFSALVSTHKNLVKVLK